MLMDVISRCLKTAHDDGDVVFATFFVGFGNQPLTDQLRFLLVLKNGSDASVGDHLGQAIGTQQENIVGFEVEFV